jgi:hypothetical protein
MNPLFGARSGESAWGEERGWQGIGRMHIVSRESVIRAYTSEAVNAISNDKVSSDDCSASGRATYKCALLVGNKRQIHITERSQKLDGVYSLLHLPGIR